MQWPADTAQANAPIGVFDSGVGGLTVLRAIKEQLPHENLLYVADSQHAPYGERDPSFIIDRCQAVAAFLHQKPVKALVIACNTASVVAIEKLRSQFDIPIVGIEPAIKPATSITRSGVVGVLATSRTLKSAGVQKLCDLYGQNVDILLQPCPGLVEQIERSALASDQTRKLITGFVQPLLDANADTIVLGCTHYPFVRGLIQEIAGKDVSVIEPGAAVARQLSNRLNELNLRCVPKKVAIPHDGLDELNSTIRDCSAGLDAFYSTGEVGSVASVLSSLWGREVAVEHLHEV